MIVFEINGKRIKPENIQDSFEKLILKGIEDTVRKKVGSIRDPETGEFPTIIFRGKDINNLSFDVEGSEALIKIVKEKMGE